MAKAVISDNMKVGVQGLLLGDKVVDSCGYEVDGLTANHLHVVQAGTDPIPLVQFITIRIQQLIDLQHQTAQPVTSLANRPIPVIYGGIQ